MHRRLALVLLATAARGSLPAAAQVRSAPPAVLSDTAPAPSAGFPARWYPPADDTVYAVSRVIGHPYTADLLTTGSSLNQRTGERTGTKQATLQARDGQGRRREEQQAARPDGHGGTALVHEVTVHDPVSHCEFHWMEPWVAPGPPLATVTCQPRTIRFTNQNVWRDSIVTERKVIRSPFAITTQEPLGTRSMEGLTAEGTRSTTERLDPSGSVTGKVSLEIWYSPALDELLQQTLQTATTPAGTEAQPPGYTLQNIRRGEPDPALFYPPRGYTLRSTLPPHP